MKPKVVLGTEKTMAESRQTYLTGNSDSLEAEHATFIASHSTTDPSQDLRTTTKTGMLETKLSTVEECLRTLETVPQTCSKPLPFHQSLETIEEDGQKMEKETVEQESSAADKCPESETERPSAHHQASASTRIGQALNKLKSELVAMREQDLQLLKQLININDSIRRLKRTRWLHTAGRTSSCGVLGVRGGATPLQGTAMPGGKDGVSLLQRQRSEPVMTVPPRRLSVLTSTSSINTIADSEEVDSLYGSSTDLDEVVSATVPMATTTLGMHRSSVFAALTFTPEELTSGDSSYGEILKRNVRLWKWSVAREKETGMEGQLLSCVL